MTAGCELRRGVLTWTLQWAAITPSTGVSEKGSNILSDRRMKSGFCRYLEDMYRMVVIMALHTQVPYTNTHTHTWFNS